MPSSGTTTRMSSAAGFSYVLRSGEYTPLSANLAGTGENIPAAGFSSGRCVAKQGLNVRVEPYLAISVNKTQEPPRSRCNRAPQIFGGRIEFSSGGVAK
eukprot:5562191-Pyramimonas_sp.AAC.2